LDRFLKNQLARVPSTEYAEINPRIPVDIKNYVVTNFPGYTKMNAPDDDFKSMEDYIKATLGGLGVKQPKREEFYTNVVFLIDPAKALNNPTLHGGIKGDSYEEIQRKVSQKVNELLEELDPDEDFYPRGDGTSTFSENRKLINSIILDFRPQLKEPEGTVGGSKVTLERIAALRAQFDAINRHSQSDLDNQDKQYSDLVNQIIKLYFVWEDECGGSTGGGGAVPPVSVDFWINDWIAGGVYTTNASPKRGETSKTMAGPAYIEIVWEARNINTAVCSASRNGSNDDNAVSSHPSVVTGDRQWVDSHLVPSGSKWVGPITADNYFVFSCSGFLPGGGTGNVSDTFEIKINNN